MMRFEKLSEQWVRQCLWIQRLNRAASRVELLKCVTRRHAAPKYLAAANFFILMADPLFLRREDENSVGKT